MRATTGTGSRRAASQARWSSVMKSRALPSSSAAMSRMSAPPMKARSPAPRSTTARKLSSSPSAVSWFPSAPMSARSRMLSLPGWSTVTWAMRPAARSSMRVVMRGPCAASATLNELDLVPVGILDEGDNGGAELHRPRCARDLDAFLAELFAGGVDVADPDGEMAERGAERIGLLLVPIVGELDHRAARLVAIADEGEGVAALRHLALAQHLHAAEPRVEVERLLQVEDAEHGVQHARLAGAGGARRLGGGHRIHLVLRSISGRAAVWFRSRECRAMIASTSSAARRLGDSSPRPSRCSASRHCDTCASSAAVPEAARAASLAANASYFSRSPRRTMVGAGQPSTASLTVSTTVAVVGTTTRKSEWRRASSATAPAKGANSRATSPRRLPGNTVSSGTPGGTPWRWRKAAPS